MSILCVGLSVYDITLPLAEPFVENTKMRIHDKYECLGGQATCAACTSAKWGMETAVVSRVGNDTFGNKIVADLKTLGVNTKHIQRLDGYETSLSIIINHMNNGHRTILNQQDVIKEVAFTLPNKVDAILFDGHEEEASMLALETFPDALTVLDAEKPSPLTLALAQKVDYIVASEDFAMAYTNLDSSDEANWEEMFKQVKTLNNKHVVITLGDKGLIYEEDGEVKHIPAFKVKVVDTTGAGDIFHGAFTYGLVKGMEMKDILITASMTSALSIQKRGGMPSIPTWDEVQEALAKVKQ